MTRVNLGSENCLFFVLPLVVFNCPAGWQAGYQDNCYKLIRTSRTWSAAKHACQSEVTGGHLVSIESRAEMAYVQSIAPLYQYGYWTSGRYYPQQSTWYWDDGRTGRYNHFAY